MPVIYDGKKLIPAPFVAVTREHLKREDGATVGQTYGLVLKGSLMAWRGSPDSAGAFWTAPDYPPDESVPDEARLRAMLAKQAALRALFATEGRTLEIQSPDGSAPLKCNPRVLRVDVPEGLFWERCEYTVTLEADLVEGLGEADVAPGDLVSRVAEEWNVETLDEHLGTYRLSHSLSATGKRSYDETGSLAGGKEAWKHAEDYVLGKLRLGLEAERLVAPGVLDATALQAFNYVRSNAVNETAGLFSCSETWLCYDPQGEPPAYHEYTVEQRYNRQENRVSVSVQGTVTGLEVRDNASHALVSTRWANAEAKWAQRVLPFMLGTAEAYGGQVLNPLPLSFTVGTNPAAGTVTYNYGFDNRPVPLTPGALTETVTVANNHAADVFAQVPVPGRPFGPVLQSLSTVTAKKRTVTVDIQMPPSTTTFFAFTPVTDALVLALAPASVLGVFLENDEESWTPVTGRYTRTSTFLWE